MALQAHYQGSAARNENPHRISRQIDEHRQIKARQPRTEVPALTCETIHGLCQVDGIEERIDYLMNEWNIPGTDAIEFQQTMTGLEIIQKSKHGPIILFIADSQLRSLMGILNSMFEPVITSTGTLEKNDNG